MNSKNVFLFFFLSFFLFQNKTQAQDEPSVITALNSYVHFSNESVHGMLIVHRLLENFNQEINKYVNLQSTQLNFYGNEDLSPNIFIDKEQSFYKVSPFLWYEVIKAESRSLKPNDARKLNASVDKLKGIMTNVNNVRFEIDRFLKNNDLTKKENQKIIYQKLNKCVKWYDDFYAIKGTLQKDLTSIYAKSIGSELRHASPEIQSLIAFHRSFTSFMLSLRLKTVDPNKGKFKELERQGNAILKASIKNPYYTKAKTAVKAILKEAAASANGNSFSGSYELYGAHYYFHNVELAAGFNSYGLGFVKNANKYIKNMHPTGLLLIEEPHFLKVISAEEALEFSQRKSNGEGDIIDEVELPTEVNDRNVIVRQQVINVDTLELELSIYDHKQMDGDIISVNFNGDWVLEKHRLTKQWFKLKIILNEKGENYLLLHAENLGGSPPNTAAFRYSYQGRVRTVILNSNLNESEMIKLKYTKS